MGEEVTMVVAGNEHLAVRAREREQDVVGEGVMSSVERRGREKAE